MTRPMDGSVCPCGRTRSGEFVFVAVWPIVDESLPKHELVTDAVADLPMLARHQHAVLHGIPRWSVIPGHMIAGSRGAKTALRFMSQATHRYVLHGGECNTCHEQGALYATATRGPVCLGCWHDVVDEQLQPPPDPPASSTAALASAAA